MSLFRNCGATSIISINFNQIFGTSTQNFQRLSYICRLCDCHNSIILSQITRRSRPSCSRFEEKRRYVRASNVFDHNVLQSSRFHSFQRIFVNQISVRSYSVHAASVAESIAQTQAGWFQALSESTVVSYAQDSLVSVHDLTGLPWWASIVLTTFMMRAVVTMPLAVYQNCILAKVENLQLEMPEIVKELKIETAFAMKKFNWSEKHARTIYNRSLRKQWKKLIIRDNCHPFKASLLLLVQLPMWVCFSTALRNMVYMLPEANAATQITFWEMSIGGFGWIPNLTIPDSSLILPVTFGLLNLVIIEVQAMTRTKQSTRLQKIATNAFRVLSVVLVPIAANVPSCLCLYWAASSLFGLSQNLLLLSPKVKRVTGIPHSASQVDRPYTQIVQKIKERATWFYKPFASK